ncbi:glycoside hydrolase family 81 protein [Sodiomyces alcalophilus JCM 7366]|uniref:glycoside hydrolase family 81 protein n=1 Tax=Sodiomyces alcalophilus JCM 7366 TaxID=591952 RepID=UPI0039B50783
MVQVAFCEPDQEQPHAHRHLHRPNPDTHPPLLGIELQPRLLGDSFFDDSLPVVCQTETAYSTTSVPAPTAPATPPLSSLLGFASDDFVAVTTQTVGTAIAQIPASLSDKTPQTSGLVVVELETEGHVTLCRIIEDPIPSPKTSIQVNSSLLSPVPPVPEYPSEKFVMPLPDIFAEPISTAPPPPWFEVRNDHPAEKKGVISQPPIQTNKFFSNFFVGDQSAPTYTYPYSIAWAAGKGPAGSHGIAISHIEAQQRVYGPTKQSGAASYFINPVGIQSIIVSAKELGNETALATDNITAFSARVHLQPHRSSTRPAVSFPLVQGMAFVTAQYAGATPVIQTGVFFRNVTRVMWDPKPGVVKFNMHLEDGRTWRIYSYATRGDPLELHVVNNGYAEARRPFYGIIQVAKDPGNGEALYDEAAGVFPTNVELTGTASHTVGSYTFNFAKEGHPQGRLLMYALPHHVDSFDGATRSALRDMKLQTPTKGIATAVMADQWTMVEHKLPVDMTFAPWDPERGTLTKMSDQARAAVRRVAIREASQDMAEQSDLDSMYFSGKALAKFGILLVAINDFLGDRQLAHEALGKLKYAFGRFAANRQKFPLVYERVWGGLVSSGSYITGDTNADFGNTMYNDHHFHYGYHILAAAAIAHLDPSWIPENKAYVDLLIRDFANPSDKDRFFPPWRSFDWYHGHSWAHGLHPSFDGKDQESSSEDMMQAYAIKMWGMVTGDANMAMRGNLQLAVLARSLSHYYLYTDDNQVQPEQFVGNKVAGILFENKCDHTTYFGANIEYIQGIHMIPLLAPSPFIRSRRFVSEEWDVYFSQGRVHEVEGGWRGIVFGNLATVNPAAAWDFFNQTNFDPAWIDGGASLTWYLTYTAIMGGI